MPLIPIQIPWTTKPPLGTPIDWSNPLTQGLVGAWAFNEGGGAKVLNNVNQELALFDHSGVMSWSPEGMGIVGYTGLDFGLAINGPLTWGFTCNVDNIRNINLNNVTEEGSAIVLDNGGQKILMKVASGYSSYVYWYFPQYAVGKTYSFLFTSPGPGSNASDIRCYVDGLLLPIWISGGTVPAAGSIGMGASGIYYTEGRKTNSLFALDRILSLSEIQSLSANPWQIYQPQTIWVSTAVASAGWAKKIFGISPAKVQGISSADIAKVLGV